MTILDPTTRAKFLGYSARLGGQALEPFLADYKARNGEPAPELALAAALSSLRHWADREGVRFDRAATLGEAWHRAEVGGQE